MSLPGTWYLLHGYTRYLVLVTMFRLVGCSMGAPRDLPGWNARLFPTSRGLRQATSRTEVSSNSSSRTKPSVSPAMAALFFMADRRGVGWLSVTDIQVRVRVDVKVLPPELQG